MDRKDAARVGGEEQAPGSPWQPGPPPSPARALAQSWGWRGRERSRERGQDKQRDFQSPFPGHRGEGYSHACSGFHPQDREPRLTKPGLPRHPLPGGEGRGMSQNTSSLDDRLRGRRWFWKKNKQALGEGGSQQQMLAGEKQRLGAGRAGGRLGCTVAPPGALWRQARVGAPGSSAGPGREVGQRKRPWQDATSQGSSSANRQHATLSWV